MNQGFNAPFRGLILALLAGFLSIGTVVDAAQPDPDRTLTLDQARQQLAEAVPEMADLMAEFMLYLAGHVDADSGTLSVGPEELQAFEEHSEKRTEQLEVLMEQAVRRLASEPNDRRLTDTLLSMSSPELYLFLLQSRALEELWPERLSGLVASAPELGDRLIELARESSSFMALALSPSLHDQVEAGMDTESIREMLDTALGAEALPIVLEALPQSRRLSFLEAIAKDEEPSHLRESLVYWAGNAGLARALDLPPEWIRAQVAAGHDFWLSELASSEDEAGLDFLHEQMLGLPPLRQLQLVAERPDPLFLAIVHDIHAEAIRTLECVDCEHDQTLDVMLFGLVRAYARLDLPESLDMLEQLIEALPDDQPDSLMQTVVHELRYADSKRSTEMAIAYLIRYPATPIDVMSLTELAGNQPDRLEAIIRPRLAKWQKALREPVEDGEETAPFFPWQGCSEMAGLLLAHGHGLYDDWPALSRAMLASEAPRGLSEQCDFQLHRAAVNDEGGRALQALLDLWDGMEVSSDRYWSLVLQALNADGENSTVRRTTLLAHLEVSPVWPELPDQVRQRLEGADPPPTSCSAAEDWPAEEI